MAESITPVQLSVKDFETREVMILTTLSHRRPTVKAKSPVFPEVAVLTSVSKL